MAKIQVIAKSRVSPLTFTISDQMGVHITVLGNLIFDLQKKYQLCFRATFNLVARIGGGTGGPGGPVAPPLFRLGGHGPSTFLTLLF